jgi:hypothetical protein
MHGVKGQLHDRGNYKTLRKATYISLVLTCVQPLVIVLRNHNAKNIDHSEYDHYITMTSRMWFHADHINMCVWIVQETTSESTKIS